MSHQFSIYGQFLEPFQNVNQLCFEVNFIFQHPDNNRQFLYCYLRAFSLNWVWPILALKVSTVDQNEQLQHTCEACRQPLPEEKTKTHQTENIKLRRGIAPKKTQYEKNLKKTCFFSITTCSSVKKWFFTYVQTVCILEAILFVPQQFSFFQEQEQLHSYCWAWKKCISLGKKSIYTPNAQHIHTHAFY